MAESGGMTLREASQMQASLQSKVTSITDLIGSNDHALMSLCRTPEFLAYYRESFGVDKSVSDATVIADIEGSIKPVEQPKQEKPVESPFGKKDRATVILNRGFCSNAGKVAPKRGKRNHSTEEKMMSLECGVDGITTRGMIKGGTAWSQYELVTMGKFVKLWEDYVAPNRKGRQWLGIYAIRVTKSDGAVSEYVVSKFGRGLSRNRDWCVQDVVDQAPMLDVYYYPVEFVLARLIQVLYDEFGDACIQELGKRVADAWLSTNGQSPLKELFITEEILRSRGETSDNGMKYVRLPGQFVLNGVTDHLFIYQSNLEKLRNSEYSDRVFKDFRNVGYFSVLFMSLAQSLMPEKKMDEIKKWCDSTIQFLILPE